MRLSYSPTNPTPNDTIYFQADASDPDGDPLTYRWFVNDVEQTRATAPNVQWSNPTPGTYTMRVIVSDGRGGMAEDRVKFTVQGGNRPPRLELRPPENPELVFTQEYGFTYKYCFQAVSYDDDKDQMTHEWFFDGQQASNIGTVEGSPTENYSVASSYPCWLPVSQGSHTVVVRASDSKGGATEKEYSFTMKGQWVHVRMTGGEAQLRIGDQWYDLKKGVEVSITDGIRSGDISIRCWGGTTVYLAFADGSKLYFDCRSPSVHDDPGGGTISIDHGPLGESLEIGPGNVRVHVQNVKIERWEAAGWHGGKLGTDFEIDVQPNGTVTVYTFDGVVWFADSQETKVVHIRAGEHSIGVPGSVPSDPKPFDSSSFERWWESEIPPLPGTKTIEQALDTDRDRIIGDLEMLQALQYWIKQQIVPGTNKTIDDLMMLTLLEKWIKAIPIR
ncbi:MAG: PKD domain-containing protein [Candidatus Caldarchaeum sp.]